MKAYDKVLSVINAEHEVVNVLYNYIDRMNDATESDTMEKIGAELIEDLKPAISNHLSALSALLR